MKAYLWLTFNHSWEYAFCTLNQQYLPLGPSRGGGGSFLMEGLFSMSGIEIAEGLDPYDLKQMLSPPHDFTVAAGNNGQSPIG